MFRTEFKDAEGNTVAVIESENSEFLVAVEGRVLGTRIQTDVLDVWIASAEVTEDGIHVMEYGPFYEKEDQS